MVLCDRNSIIPLPLDSPALPQRFAGIIRVFFVANKAGVFACVCYRLGSQSVHLYVNFTPVILQHRNIVEHKY